MTRTFRATGSLSLRRELDVSLALIRQQLSFDHFHAVFPAALHQSEPRAETTASKPVREFVDDDGNRYWFKSAEPELVAAEVCAYQVRRLAKKPAVPARAVRLRVDGTPFDGVLKPFVELSEAAQLPAHTTEWTPLQRATILTEHVWEWFLSNFDTNVGQYALFQGKGDQKLPVNLDWDRAFHGEPKLDGPTRFEKYRLNLPNAHTFLYADFVEGRTTLPLRLLRNEATRVKRLSAHELKPILHRYASIRFPQQPAQQEAWVDLMLLRRTNIVQRFGAFERELVAERRKVAEADGVAVAAPAWCWHQVQLLLHGLSRGAVGRAARTVLRTVRRNRAAADPGE